MPQNNKQEYEVLFKFFRFWLDIFDRVRKGSLDPSAVVKAIQPLLAARYQTVPEARLAATPVMYEEDVCIIQLNGKMTLDTEIVFNDAIAYALVRIECKKILLDMSELSYVDSTGIGALVVAHKKARDLSAVIKLLNPIGKVEDLLQLTKLVEVFPVFKDQAAALKSFKIPNVRTDA